MRRFLSILIVGMVCLFIINPLVQGQTVYHSVNNVSVYEYLDELANIGVIDLSTAVKPYSRKLIAEKLYEAKANEQALNARQAKELAFYLRDFDKEHQAGKYEHKRLDLLYYKDEKFTLTVNPILGFNYMVNDSGGAFHRWNGAEAWGYVGNFGFYTSLRDNSESLRLSDPDYLSQRQGAVYKPSGAGGEYSEMRGGVTYNWDWGTLGLVKDQLTWGNNNHGANIFSDHAPSFAQIKLQLKPVDWIELNYFHGWLVSQVLDSNNIYNGGFRERYAMRPKYIAANLLTVRPFKKLYVSIGNSMVYSDQPVQAAYLIPVMFYKSVDHTLGAGLGNRGGQNAQMYLDISSRQIKQMHLYTTLFVDEIAFGRFWDKNQHSNFISLKLGASYTNPFNSNLVIIAEYTRSNPMTYKHFMSTTTFASNLYNMGHYLRDNSREIYAGVRYRPINRLQVTLGFVHAEVGKNYVYTGIGQSAWGLPYLDEIRFRQNLLHLQGRFELFNDLYGFLDITHGLTDGADVAAYTNRMGRGQLTTFAMGLNVGF